MEEQRSYYSIIPANVRYDKDLPPNAKLLYGEITALCNDKGYCWASNDYFATLYGVSKVSISNWISMLVKKGYISSEIIYKEGTKEILNRYLKLFNDPIKEIFNTPIKENFKDNNTYINNTLNNKEENKLKEEKFKKPTLEEIKQYCEERKNYVHAEAFYDFYESKGWLVGKSKMKDWKACVRTWERNAINIKQKKSSYLDELEEQWKKEGII